MSGAGSVEAWEDLADVLLQRAALTARVARDRSPDPLAGLKVDDADLAALLGELPGMDDAWWRAEEVQKATADAVDAAMSRFADSLDRDDRFAELVRSARLEVIDAVLLAVLCAVESDPRRQRLVGYLNDDVTARRPTIWTLAQLGDHAAAVAALSPSGALRRACLLERAAEGTWSASPISISPTVLWWLHGASGAEPDLPPGVDWIPGDDVPAIGRVAVAAGPDRVRRLQALTGGLGAASFLVVPGAAHEPAAWDAIVRQATLAGAGIVLELDDELPPVARDRIEAAGHLSWGIASRRELPVACLPSGWRGVDVQSSAATAAEWEAAFGPDTVGTHPLTAEQVELASRALAATGGKIDDALRRLAAGHIDSVANRIRPSRTWDDLVLDEDREELVRTVAVRCRQRRKVYEEWGFSPFPSKGVVALFAGPSGTGKTLAAEVIAGDLGLDLYAVDLANLVSKYIGETEKNLSRIFDAAEASNVALFFDEADALLGKRSVVSDAHDRYANIEVAYLLQRLERYDGLAVLATNLANNIDPAFVRRLHVIVEFAVPGPAERHRIWARCLPSGAPRGKNLDLDLLAERFEVTGGTIRNAALAAAFLAAEKGTPINMALAVKGMQMELRKIGRLVSDNDLLHG